MKIIAFAASSSKSSINKQFATFTARALNEENTEVLDLNDYALPLFDVNVEKESGIPENAVLFYEKLQSADVLVISLAEHNGSYTAVFKNLFDWVSRHELKMFAGKKLILLSTAPGPRGGLSVLETAKDRFPRHGAEVIATFSLPKFKENFSVENGISEPELKASFDTFIKEIMAVL